MKMNYGYLRDSAGKVDTQRESFDGVVSSMQSIINELQSEWEGNAANEFAGQFDRLKNSAFKEITQLFVDLAKQLRDSAEIMEKAENDIAGVFKAGAN